MKWASVMPKSTARYFMYPSKIQCISSGAMWGAILLNGYKAPELVFFHHR